MEPNATIPFGASSAEPQKKFIRTFESDMATLKQGGTPSLTPYQSASDPVQAEAAPVVPTPELTAPTPAAATPYVPERLDPLPVPEPTPAAPAAMPVPEVPRPQQTGSAPLETYAGDFSKRIQDTNASMTTVLAAEQDSATGEPVPEPPAQKSNRVLIVVGVFLLIAGVVGTYFAYRQFATTNAVVIPQFTVQAPIFVDEREQLTGTGSALSQAIAFSVAKPLAVNTVRLLSLAPASTTANESVFSAIGFSGAPDLLRRNIVNAGSIAGIVHTSDAQSAFFILSVTSYSDTFGGMLLWEPAMIQDLAGLYPTYPVAPLTVVATTTAPVATTTVATTTTKTKTTTKKKTTAVVPAKVATSTPVVPVKPPAPSFHDEVVANHDVRVYRDAFGQSIMLYGYWNKQTLIIARSPEAFTELVNRLATSHTGS